MSRVVLITGGARSGKSGHALELARGYQSKAFIATALAGDEEMRERIARHRAEREASFTTVEEPLDLAAALRSLNPRTGVAVVDCLTLWVANLMEQSDGQDGDFRRTDEFLAALEDPPCDVVVVTNEVGMGIVPANAAARRFRDLAGRLNQRVAAVADEVIFMVCGMPMKLGERDE